MGTSRPTCCWVGSARYSEPLDATSAHKWRALAALGIPMIVIGFASGLRPRTFVQDARFILLPSLPTPPLRYLTAALLIPPIILWASLRHDLLVLIAQSPPEGALAALGMIVSRIFGRQNALVVESHGDFEHDIFLYRRIPLERVIRALIVATARFAFRYASALRAISVSTRSQLERFASGKPVEQFMAWTDSQVFLETPRSGPPSASTMLIYAGVLIPRKGVHHLIDAFASIAEAHPQARLALVGEAQNRDYTAQIKAQIDAAGLTDRVLFVGKVTQADLAHWLAGGRVLVLPSLSEGLGRVIVESMLCGTPVIGSDVGGIPDIVQDGVTGMLVPPGDPIALANALSRALAGTEIDRMGELARSFATAYFSPEVYVEAHRRLIAAALRGAGLST